MFHLRRILSPWTWRVALVPAHLIVSLGLLGALLPGPAVSSPPSCLKAGYTRRVHRSTTDWLHEVGLNSAQVSKAVARFPHLLGLSIEANLKPTVNWLHEVGLNSTQVSKAVATFRQLLGYSIEANLSQKLSILQRYFTDASLRDMVTAFPTNCWHTGSPAWFTVWRLCERMATCRCSFRLLHSRTLGLHSDLRVLRE